MRLARILAVRTAEADARAAHDEGRPLIVLQRRRDRGLDIRHVVTVHAADIPAVCVEAGLYVFRERQGSGSVDTDAVVVVQNDELAETEMTRERAGLVRQTLHEVAVAGNDIGPMIEQRELRTIVSLREPLLRDRHTHRIAEPLAERAGRGLHAWRHIVFGVSGRSAVQLAETHQLFER